MGFPLDVPKSDQWYNSVQQMETIPKFLLESKDTLHWDEVRRCWHNISYSTHLCVENNKAKNLSEVLSFAIQLFFLTLQPKSAAKQKVFGDQLVGYDFHFATTHCKFPSLTQFLSMAKAKCHCHNIFATLEVEHSSHEEEFEHLLVKVKSTTYFQR